MFGHFMEGKKLANLAKSGHKLEKVSQSRGLRFHLKKRDFLKQE
jgi:hypothetical protein